MSRRRRARWVALAVAAVVAVVVVVAALALTGDDDEPPAAPTAAPSPTPSSLADVDTETLAVARDRFCDDVPEDAVADALGGEPTDTSSYDNGQRARLTRQVRDVSHEFHCEWRGPGGVRADGWVFAPPVTPELAGALARQARRADGCQVVDDATAFGTTSAVTRCSTPLGQQIGYAGLFGDAWLTCTLTVPDDASGTGTGPSDQTSERADRWCAAVAEAASAS